MFRSFTITIADTNYHNLFSLIVGTSVYGAAQGGSNETAITGAVPSSGICPDEVYFVYLLPPAGGATLADNNNANNAGVALPTAGLSIPASRGINLKEMWVKLTTGGQALGVCFNV